MTRRRRAPGCDAHIEVRPQVGTALRLGTARIPKQGAVPVGPGSSRKGRAGRSLNGQESKSEPALASPSVRAIGTNVITELSTVVMLHRAICPVCSWIGSMEPLRLCRRAEGEVQNSPHSLPFASQSPGPFLSGAPPGRSSARRELQKAPVRPSKGTAGSSGQPIGGPPAHRDCRKSWLCELRSPPSWRAR